MDNPTKFIGLIGGALATMGAVYTLVTFTHDKIQLIDEQSAQLERQAKDIKRVRGDILMESLKNEVRWTQRRVFHIEEEYGEQLKDAPSLVREEYKQDKIDLENLEQELKSTRRIYLGLQ